MALARFAESGDRHVGFGPNRRHVRAALEPGRAAFLLHRVAIKSDRESVTLSGCFARLLVDESAPARPVAD